MIRFIEYTLGTGTNDTTAATAGSLIIVREPHDDIFFEVTLNNDSAGVIQFDITYATSPGGVFMALKTLGPYDASGTYPASIVETDTVLPGGYYKCSTSGLTGQWDWTVKAFVRQRD